MSFPKHTEAILVQNQFYSAGLTELDVWNYYQGIKNKLFLETMSRDLMVFIAIDINKTTVLRKGKLTKFIRLNRTNFDDVFNARMLSIHSTMHNTEEIAIIDIDSDNFKRNKEAAIEIYDYAISKIPFVDSAWVKFTGKNSFHIVCNLKRIMYIDGIRTMLRNYLDNSGLNRDYTIEEMRARDKNVPNIDLSPNKYRGGFITLHSLSTIGLKCMKVEPDRIASFRKEDAIIKI
jgi:hypothetical protein